MDSECIAVIVVALALTTSADPIDRGWDSAYAEVFGKMSQI